jgi:hypothetical protein
MPGKTHSMIFANEVLPSLFHSTPEAFLAYLQRDGNKFLQFYWHKAGEALPEDQRASSFGLNYEIRQPNKSTTIVMVSLPTPAREKDAFFVALIFRPLRRTPFLRISDVTKVLSLEFALQAEGKKGTRIVEWTRKWGCQEIGNGPEPTLADFYEAVIEIISKEA